MATPLPADSRTGPEPDSINAGLSQRAESLIASSAGIVKRAGVQRLAEGVQQQLPESEPGYSAAHR